MGVLEFPDGRTAACDYSLTEEPGAVELTAVHPQRGWADAEASGAMPPVDCFWAEHGDTVLTLTGLKQQNCAIGDSAAAGFKCRVRLQAAEVGVHSSSDVRATPATYNAEIVNLIVNAPISTHWARPDGWGWKHCILPMAVGGRHFTIRQVDNYSSIADTLRDDGGVAHTCSIRTRLADPSDSSEWEEVSTIVSDICFLLTFACGRMVNWTRQYATTARGAHLRGEARAAVTRPYRVMPLIDTRDGREVRRFIETCYPFFVQRRDAYSLRKVIHTRSDAANDASFMETRTLVAGALAEFLSSKYCENDGAAKAQELRGSRGQRADAAKQALKGAAIINRGNLDAYQWASERLGQATGPTLKERLKIACEGLNVGASDEDIALVARSRHNLAHTLSWATSDLRDEHRSVIHLVDRMLLRLLGYDGRYVNPETKELVALP